MGWIKATVWTSSSAVQALQSTIYFCLFNRSSNIAVFVSGAYSTEKWIITLSKKPHF